MSRLALEVLLITLSCALFPVYGRSMRCVITAGPTYEPLDEVRRLTNFSTGRLGSELAAFLNSKGHEVVLLRGEMATYCANPAPVPVETFTTTANLKERLHALSTTKVDAVFHAAAVSDFKFGKVMSSQANDTQTSKAQTPNPGKISTRQGCLLVELIPTSKIVVELRAWFPTARLVGWKYDVDGDRGDIVRLACEQIAEARTDACVANGPAYGTGFGLVTTEGNCTHVGDKAELFRALEKLVT